MKKILILGGSHRDIPLIKAAQELGYYVITVGDKEYYLGHKASNKAYLVDFNDFEALQKIYFDEGVEYLLPGCGEQSYLNTVKLSFELGIGNFDSMEVASLVHNKWKFKEFCLTHNISTPKGYYYSQEYNTQKLEFPLVVKPTNLSGGRGVKVTHNTQELQQALEEAKQHSDEIFVEEFIEGTLIAYSVFIENKKIIYAFSGADDVYLNKYLITTAYPITLEENTLLKLKNDIEKIASTLNFVDGMFHTQVIIKKSIPYIIDVTRRIAGDFYPDLIERCDGVHYSQAVVKSYCGEKLINPFSQKNKKQTFVIRHVIMPNKNGTYEKLFIDESIKERVVFRFDLMSQGDKIEDFLHTQVAIVFIKLEEPNTTVAKKMSTLIYPLLS